MKKIPDDLELLSRAQGITLGEDDLEEDNEDNDGQQLESEGVS